MNQIFNVPEPSPELYLKIIKRLRKEKHRAAILRTGIFLFISVLSAGFIIFGVLLLLEALSQSGFTQIISLIFSDYQIIMASWQNYALAILETAPLLPIAYLLIACLIFLLALRKGLLNLQRLILKY